jgi:hypothetical protein
VFDFTLGVCSLCGRRATAKLRRLAPVEIF